MTPAGFWIRLMAYNIDFLFYLLAAVILRWLIDSAPTMYTYLGVFVFCFEVGFLASKPAATPGRKMMNLTVLDQSGQKLSVSRIAVRTLFKPISLLLFFGGFAMIAFRADKKGLHDLLSGSATYIAESRHF